MPCSGSKQIERGLHAQGLDSHTLSRPREKGAPPSDGGVVGDDSLEEGLGSKRAHGRVRPGLNQKDTSIIVLMRTYQVKSYETASTAVN